MSEWGPAFVMHLGMQRRDMLDLSVPELVNTFDYANDLAEWRSRRG